MPKVASAVAADVEVAASAGADLVSEALLLLGASTVAPEAPLQGAPSAASPSAASPPGSPPAKPSRASAAAAARAAQAAQAALEAARAPPKVRKVPTEVPPEHHDRYKVLMALPIEEVREMLREIDLPEKGAHRNIVVRLIRHLAELPPARADEKVMGRKSLEDIEKEEAMEATRRALEEARKNQKPPMPKAATGKGKRSGAGDQAGGPVKAARLGESPSGAPSVQAAHVEAPQKGAVAPEDAPTAEDSGSSSSSDGDSDEEPNDEAGAPGADVVPVAEDEVDLLDGKKGNWLKHFRAATKSKAELSIGKPPRTSQREEEDIGPPVRLAVASPNGQGACAGEYVIEAELRASGLRVWKKEGSEHWLYSGRNDTWFIGGTREKGISFECSTGYINLASRHGGSLPDTMCGTWRRSDGKQWVEDEAIQVSASSRMGRPQPGLHVRIAGFRRDAPQRHLNGRFGRIVARDEGNDTWRVRLADGRDESIPAVHLLERQVPYAETWIRGGASGADSPAMRLRCMLVALRSECIDTDDLPVDMSGMTFLEVPAKAVGLLRLVYVKLLMEQTGVIAVLAQERMAATEGGEDADVVVKETKLVIFGEPRERFKAALRAMVFIEKSAPGHYAAAPLPTFRAAGVEDPELADYGCSQLRLGDGVEGAGMADLERHADAVAAVEGVVVEAAGASVAFIGGPARRRDLALTHLRLASQATSQSEVTSVPQELEPQVTRALVPGCAWSGVAQLIVASEKEEERARCYWMRPPEDAPECPDILEDDVKPGSAVTAEYEEKWHDAKIVEAKWSEYTATIAWGYDDSHEEVSIDRLRPTLSKPEAARRERLKARAEAWTLLIVGDARPRLTLALRVLGHVEDSHPGILTTDFAETMEGLRTADGGEEAGVAVEGKLVGAALGEPWYGAAEKHGYFAQRRASLATGCAIQLLGKAAMLVLGTRQERSLGMEYLRWVLAIEQPLEAIAPQAPAPSVVGADGRTAAGSGGPAVRAAIAFNDGDGDPVEFRRRREEGVDAMDYFAKGELRLRDIHTLRLEGALVMTLHVSGTSCVSGSPSLCVEVPTGQEAVAQEVVQLFHVVRAGAMWASRANRKDVKPVSSTRGRNSELKLRTIREIERSSGCVVLVGGCGGDGTDLDAWDPAGAAEVHVCGPGDEARAKAAEEVRKLVGTVPAVAAGAADAAATEEPAAKRPRTDEPEAAAAAAALLAADDAVPTDPLAELRSLGYWPKDYPAWREVQDKVWANHPKLASGWFRVWSRSKDREYYVRLPHYRATFDLVEAMQATKTPYGR